MGLDGLLRARGSVVSGILNGIDTEVWDPANDPDLAAAFDGARIEARAANKTDLRDRFGLEQSGDGPLFGVVSRLSWQKGLDLLLEALPTLLATDSQLALLGSGDPGLEAGFRAASSAHPGRIACMFGYDEATAHRIQAGSDAILVPSRFEPCGLTQLCALRYGAVPVVARVGGLADSVIDANPAALGQGVATGLQFSPVTAEMLRVAIERTAALYREPAVWRRLQANGMSADVSWRDPARRYATLFRDLIGAHR
jgi:starch synthase